MKVTPFKVLFEVNTQGSGHYRYGMPTKDIIPMQPEDDEGYYVLHTHDRGENRGPGPYYQVAFRIDDPSPYALKDLTLTIDNQSFRKGSQVVDNDLFYDEEHDLWYQKSRYEYDKKNNRWSIVSENKKSALHVDCITTAGVFKVVVLHKGIPLVGYTQPWIYVLPSSITKDEYSSMLDDLIRLHERLVLRDKSTVGIGSIQEAESGSASISSEIKSIDRFLQLLKIIMKLPSEQQSKRYIKADIHRTQHFDSRVLRDYLRSGGIGKVSAVEFYSDHDTYEHRVIKKFIRHYLQKHAVRRAIDMSKYADIEAAVNTQFKQIISVKNAQHSFTASNSVDIHEVRFTGHAPTWSGYSLCIAVRGNVVETRSHHPFATTGNRYVGVRFIAHGKRELIWHLKCLAQCCSHYGSMYLKYCQSDYSPINSGRYIENYTFCDVLTINDEERPSDYELDMSDVEYAEKLNNLCRQYSFISLDQPCFDIVLSPSISIRPNSTRDIMADANEQAMKADLRAQILEKYEQEATLNRYYEKLDALANILESEWFQAINDSNLRQLTHIEPTAKFLYNPYYSEIYRLISTFIKKQPLLTSDFDINGFGVMSTQLVYEYWVFYKLLDYFDHCGFSISSTNETLKEHFKRFVDSAGENSKFSGIVMTIERKIGEIPLCIELGYDCVLKSSEIQRRPDFYLKIEQHGTNHWYFLDAKYKSFSKGQTPNTVDYTQEVWDVSIQKYITEMTSILNENGTANIIMGSYIVMASIQESDHEISENGRLFGAHETIIKQPQSSRIENEYGMPCHRYGAIWLSTNNDSELPTLMSLIFEYLEAGKRNTSHLLNVCWRCGTDVSSYRNATTTTGGGTKYYVTCPTCSSFRVDNFCLNRNCHNSIIKHTNLNYHQRSYTDMATDKSKQWGFYCPMCGKGLEDASQRSESVQFISYATTTTNSHFYTPTGFDLDIDELPF